MCIGSVATREKALACVDDVLCRAKVGLEEADDSSDDAGLDDEELERADMWAEEEDCGIVWEDGIRRFGRRHVLCSGSHVLVHGWSATVRRVNLNSATVEVAWHALPWRPTEVVPLASLRSLYDWGYISRDVQWCAGKAARHMSRLYRHCANCAKVA
eukprot:TRINITY_DN12264_c1_g1_i1.p3 TRINITY_DN12264_c1_g1~~TRINITY_DN12264_c1_g1_i1.p3  ORF type:complete len:157 (+),score=40.28 TRINITY_DN12264_c1_g1_i1:68-538(+)